jgi:acetyltransferase-like isoleucine patch superfamily enzyme
MLNFFKKKLILVGSRNNLTDIVETARDNGYKIIGILDSHYWGNTKSICGIPIIGSEQELLDSNSKWRKYNFFPANWWDGKQASKDGFDADKLRQERINLLDQANVKVINLIDTGVHWFHRRQNLKLGKGILILRNSSISENVTIGDYSVIDWEAKIVSSTIGRNCIIGVDSIMAHAVLGDNVRVGVRSVILPRKKPTVNIGNNAILYVNSLVLEDVADGGVYTMYGRTKKRITKVV